MRLALYPLVQQFQFRNGTNLVAGKIYVYYRGRTRLATIYKDQNGTIAQNPLTCDADGRAPCFVDTNYQYTIVVCDARGKELFSQDLDADNAININDALSGDSKLYIINSDGTISVNATSGDTWIQYDLGTFNKPLGVQSPLYWAQDDEECSIIGASGLATSEEINHVSGVVDTKLDKTELSSFVENQLEPTITNIEHDISHISGVVDTKHDTTAFNSYSGSVKNTFDYISGQVDTKLPTNTFNSYSANVNGQITHISGVVDNKVNKNTFDNFTRDEGLRDNFLSGEIDKKYDTTAFSSVSGSFLTAIPDDVVREDELTAYQPIGEYATTADITGKQDTLTFGYTDNKISEINGSALYGQGGDPSDYELSAGEGISIVNDPINSATIISVSGDYATNTDLQTVSGEITAMIPTALTGDYLDKASADTLYYGINNPSGFITGVDLDPYQTKEDMTAYQPVGNYQTAGDYYSASNPSGFLVPDDITGKQDITAMTAYQLSGDYATNTQLSEVSSSITAMIPTGEFELCAGSGIELVDDPNAKTTTISVTAQGGNPEVEAEVIAHSADWNTVGDKLDTTAFSDVSGSFLTAVPDTYLQNSDLEFSDNKITGISGVPLAGGGDVPEGVMVESGLEYDNTEISGYSGSAFKDVALTDVVNANSGAWGGSALPISAGPGIKFEMVDNTLVARTDETILFFAGNDSSGAQTGNLTESIMNFERIRVAGMDNDGHVDVKYIYPAWTKNADNFDATGYEVMLYGGNPVQNTVWEKWTRYSFSSLTSFNVVLSYEGSYTANSLIDVTNSHKNSIREVVGINRTAGGN